MNFAGNRYGIPLINGGLSLRIYPAVFVRGVLMTLRKCLNGKSLMVGALIGANSPNLPAHQFFYCFAIKKCPAFAGHGVNNFGLFL